MKIFRLLLSLIMISSSILIIDISSLYASGKELNKAITNIQQNPRYQVLQVEYESYDLNGKNITKAVLKIDVITGETWILEDSIYKLDGNKVVINRGWENIERHIDGNTK